MSDARQLLADIDKVLNKEIGKKHLELTVTYLDSVQKLMTQLNDTQ